MTIQPPRLQGVVDPLDIYQAMLDFVSDAVIRGDVEQYLSAVTTPYTIHTDTKRFDLTETGALRATLECVSGGFRRQGVTVYIRLARTANYLTRHRITGTHYTHIIRDTERIAPPYVASQTLLFDGAVWRFCEARYAIVNDALPFTVPVAGKWNEPVASRMWLAMIKKQTNLSFLIVQKRVRKSAEVFAMIMKR